METVDHTRHAAPAGRGLARSVRGRLLLLLALLALALLISPTGLAGAEDDGGSDSYPTSGQTSCTVGTPSDDGGSEEGD